jgi:hypothetical protein
MDHPPNVYPSLVAVVESKVTICPIVFPVSVAGVEPVPPLSPYVTLREIALQEAVKI